jgi:hypothetical protein
LSGPLHRWWQDPKKAWQLCSSSDRIPQNFHLTSPHLAIDACEQGYSMNMQPQVIRHEAMRIAGTRVDNEERIDVYNPYANKLVGTVSNARPEHVRAAFAKG